MTTLKRLSDDQRLMLHLLLEERRSYAEIAELLSIDRAAVRARTLAAYDTLGPPSNIPFERRALIVDYLAGQLPIPVAEEIRAHVSESASERAWVAAVTNELDPALSTSLTDLPKTDSTKPTANQQEPHARVAAPANPNEALPPDVEEPISRSTRRRVPRLSTPVLATSTAAILAIGAVIVVLSAAGASRKHASLRTTTRASEAVSSTSTAASTPTSTTKTSVHVLAQIKLAPAASASKVTGIAEVLQQGSTKGLVIGAKNVAPNTKHPPNAYAVWLYNSPADARILGFVSPRVGKNGRLTTAGALPSNASRYRTMIVTLETHANPKTPGIIILRGTLAGL